ncbi:carboxymuconolactone decarboxylase family protein [Marinobacter sp. AC-23]|uniref:carboxymuconolactone decarboxylase family protein n=1 Tax=Marinobacter sp. AC-23 TaxID=1879031 RepID=UPI0008DCA9C3|nr:carboxymuconolactone decarboxylase family protein [Marinobacter sp. AC-23]OHY80830.1 carboxymuconolactone decarboxylase [Marinobacter sp. AC-23]
MSGHLDETALNEKTAKGKEIMDRLEAGAGDRVTSRLAELDADLPKLITDYAFADVIGRPGLKLKTREMLTVAALTAMGTAHEQLEFHMRGALNVGVSKEELLEIVIQMAVYAGVPACMNGITAYRSVLAAQNDRL